MIELYLGTRCAGWAVDGRTRAWARHEDPVEALSRWSTDIVRAHAPRRRRVRVVLWLSGGLARPLIAAPVAGLRGWQEAEALVAAAAPEATGLTGPCAVRVESWPEPGAAIATAIDRSLDSCFLETRGIDWQSVRPWWSAVLDDALRQRPGLCLLAVGEEDALTVLGGPSAASTLDTVPPASFDLALTHAPLPAVGETTALWHRLLLTRDVLADDALFARLEVALPDSSASSPRWPLAAWGLRETAA